MNTIADAAAEIFQQECGSALDDGSFAPDANECSVDTCNRSRMCTPAAPVEKDCGALSGDGGDIGSRLKEPMPAAPNANECSVDTGNRSRMCRLAAPVEKDCGAPSDDGGDIGGRLRKSIPATPNEKERSTDTGNRSRMSMPDTPAVGRYEEVPNASLHEMSTSFRCVVTSTPKIPLSRPEHLPLDLSGTLTDLEDEPLDLSVKHSSEDPLDLVLQKLNSSTSLPHKPSLVAVPLNLMVSKPEPNQIKEEHSQQTVKRIDGRRASVEDSDVIECKLQSDPKSNNIDHNYSRSIHPVPCTGVLGKQIVDQSRNGAALQSSLPCKSPKSSKDLSSKQITSSNEIALNTVGALEQTGPASGGASTSMEVATLNVLADSDDQENDGLALGDASLLNDFSIFEYFQPYHNMSLIEPDHDEEDIEAQHSTADHVVHGGIFICKHILMKFSNKIFAYRKTYHQETQIQ